MSDNCKIVEKIIWVIYGVLLIGACGTVVIVNNWVGYTYMALSCAAVFIDDLKIVKGSWVQFIPMLLTIAYLTYEHEPVLYILKNIFNSE